MRPGPHMCTVAIDNVIMSRARIDQGAINGVITSCACIDQGAINGAPTEDSSQGIHRRGRIYAPRAGHVHEVHR